MKPIPKKLLIHTILYFEKNEDGRYGGGFKSPVEIKNVLIQPSMSKKRAQGSDEKVNKSILFIDVVNSSPVIEMLYDSKVVFDSKEYIVKKVTPVYGFSLHHYEVELT